MHEWNDHFLQRYTSVLKCVLIKVDIIIIVVGIGEEIILYGEYIGGRHIQSWQFCFFRFFDFKYLTVLKIQVFALLGKRSGLHAVAEVRS